jgi:hypothetical protein
MKLAEQKTIKYSFHLFKGRKKACPFRAGYPSKYQINKN